MGRKRKRNGSAVEQSRKFTCWPPTIVIFRSSIGNKYVEPTAINSYLSTRFSRFNNGRRLPHVAHSHSGYRSPAQNLERVEKPRWRIVSWLKLSRIIVRVTAIANILHSKICNFFFLFLPPPPPSPLPFLPLYRSPLLFVCLRLLPHPISKWDYQNEAKQIILLSLFSPFFLKQT